MLAAQVVKLTSERNRVLSIVCNDNPYLSFWWPRKGLARNLRQKCLSGLAAIHFSEKAPANYSAVVGTEA